MDVLTIDEGVDGVVCIKFCFLCLFLSFVLFVCLFLF
jgi:hypothetical protein